MEQNMIWRIFEILTGVVEVMIHFWFFCRLSESSRKNYLMWGVGGAVLVVVPYICDKFSILSSYKLLLVIVISTVLFWLIFDMKLYKVILANLYCMVMILASETIVMGILMGTHGYNGPGIFLEKNAIRIEAMFFAKILYIFLLYIGIRFFVRGFKCGVKEVIILLLQTFSTSVIIFLAIELSTAETYHSLISPYFFSVVAFVSMIAYCTSFWLTEQYFKGQQMIQENIRIDEYRRRMNQYIEMKKDSQEQVRKIYHDLKNHLSAIEKMQDKNLTGLEEYIGEINEAVIPYEQFYHSGCDVLDMILREKKEKAEQEGIEFFVGIEEGCLQEYTPFTLCTIFSNALDNAIEANMRVSGRERYVRIQIQHGGHNVKILIENPCNQDEVKMAEGHYITSKKEKEMHGIGLKNLEDAVQKCKGKLDIECSDGKFLLFILL